MICYKYFTKIRIQLIKNLEHTQKTIYSNYESLQDSNFDS